MKNLTIIILAYLVFRGCTASGEIHIEFVDDFSGKELVEIDGIRRATPEDAAALVKAMAGGEFSLTYSVIAESAAAQPFVTIALPAFGAKPPSPVQSPEKLDLRALTAASEAFFAEKSRYDLAFSAWLDSARREADSFRKNVLLEQLRTASLFESNEISLGENYRRSDVAGAIIKAASRLSERGGIKVLILNTDCDDSPLGKPTRTTPLTEAEMPPDVVLLFVNTSRRPEKSPLFTDLNNLIFAAQSIQDAAAILVAAAKESWEPFRPGARLARPAANPGTN